MHCRSDFQKRIWSFQRLHLTWKWNEFTLYSWFSIQSAIWTSILGKYINVGVRMWLWCWHQTNIGADRLWIVALQIVEWVRLGYSSKSPLIWIRSSDLLVVIHFSDTIKHVWKVSRYNQAVYDPNRVELKVMQTVFSPHIRELIEDCCWWIVNV